MDTAVKDLRTEFKAPPDGYGLTPFWFWNDDLKPETIRSQIAEMRDKGIAEFMIHARKGLSVPYLSDEWFDRIGVALEEARACGMGVWIYDEDNWPSGYAGGRVTAEDPGFAGQCLRRIRGEEPVPRGAKLVAAVGDERFFQLPVPWKAAYSESLYIDNLNRKSTEAFIRFTHQQYFERFPTYFGGTIKGFFTDEPGFFTNIALYPPKEDHDAITWSDGFPEFFRRIKGYDLIPLLDKVWDCSAGSDFRVRVDYYDVLGEMYRENFFRPMRDFCEAHGVKLVGHVNFEEYLSTQVRMQGDLMKVLSMMHLSGLDRIDYHTAPKQAEKYASSTAHVYGQPRTLVELYALSGWGLNPRTIKRWANQQFVRGVDMIVPHAFYMSIEDDRRWECPPSLFLQNPYWKYFRRISDYVARMSYLLTRGKHVCPAAVYYPITTHQELVGTGSTDPSEKWDRLLVEACERLLESQIDFDFLNDDAIGAATVSGGKLELGSGDERYGAVVLVGLTNMPWATMQKLAAFAEAGGLVFLIGSDRLRCLDVEREVEFQEAFRSIAAGKNYRRTDLTGLNVRRYYGFGGAGLVQAIQSRGLADVRLAAREPAVKYLLRELADGSRVYFFVNESDAFRANAAKIRRGGAVYLADPHTGEFVRYDRYRDDGDATEIALELTPWGEQVFLVTADGDFARTADTLRPVPTGDVGSSRVFLRGDWQTEIDGAAADRPLADWAEWGKAEYSGFATYRKTFALAPEKGVRYYLDLGDVRDCAEVRVNGREAGEILWEPYRLEITDLVRAGGNTLEITVCNTLANRFLLTREDLKGDGQHFPSGLLGPVSVIAD